MLLAANITGKNWTIWTDSRSTVHEALVQLESQYSTEPKSSTVERVTRPA